MLTRHLARLNSGYKQIPSLIATRNYKTKPRFQYPPTTMSAVSDSDIVSRLQKLSIAHPEVISHAPVKGGSEWHAELQKAGKEGVQLTKTVSSFLPVSVDHGGSMKLASCYQR